MSSAELRGTRGFTLVEVLVALVLAGVLATVIFQIVRGQARFATVQSAQQEVQQNARGAVEILASELRGVQPGGLVATTASSITFVLPRAWGVSCGGGTATTLPALFPRVPDASVMFAFDGSSGMMADTSAGGAGKWGPVPGATGNGMASVTSAPALNPAPGVSGNACAAVREDADAAGVLSGVTITGSNLPTVPAGNILYLYQLARYDVTLTGTEYWIRRSQGLPAGDGSTQQPLAGPLTSANGLALTYFKSDGTQFNPGSNATDLALVARIGIKVVAHSRTKGRANLSDSVLTSVLLRNKT